MINEVLFGMFVVLTIGILGSLVLLFMEYVMKTKRRIFPNRQLQMEKKQRHWLSPKDLALSELESMIRDISMETSNKNEIRIRLERLKLRLHKVLL